MASSSEGKRLSTSSSKLCESCHINPAIKYCAECPIHLCDICTRGHRNLKYTKDHVLSDIGASSTATVSQSTTMRGCHKHNNKKFTTCCTECVQLICDSCVCGHIGHELIPLTQDAKLHQKVCSKNIQNLLDDLQEIDGMKTILQDQVTTYEDAIRVVDKWELDLLQMVKNKAAKLRQKLKELKDKKYKLLSDKVKGLVVKLHEIDQSITKLNSIRSSINIKVLENKLSASQQLIDSLEGYKTGLKPVPPPMKVENILPNGNKMTEVDCVLDDLFTEDEPGEQCETLMADVEINSDPRVVAEWRFTASNGGKDISQYGENPLKLTNITHGPGPRGEQNGAVLLPTSDDQSIVVVNPTDKLRFSQTMTFFTHIYIDGNCCGSVLSAGKPRKGLFWVFPNSTSLHVANHTGLMVPVMNVLSSSRWYKFAVAWDRNKVSIYVDGKLVKSAEGTVNLSIFKTGSIQLGSVPNDKRFVGGRMASAKLFNIALTAKEIQNLV